MLDVDKTFSGFLACLVLDLRIDDVTCTLYYGYATLSNGIHKQ